MPKLKDDMTSLTCAAPDGTHTALHEPAVSETVPRATGRYCSVSFPVHFVCGKRHAELG